ncbi:MAG TPA: response regulator [bacterium]|nr:response regulator [bacterium]
MNAFENDASVHVLLVEDNYGDVRLTIEAFKEIRGDITIHPVTDGVEALQYLRKEGAYREAMRPDLILLDLNLPRKDGREVLDQIKNDADLKRIPIVVLTTSAADDDIIQAYDSHANCYIKKPVNMDEFFSVAETIDHFWFRLVRLPPS